MQYARALGWGALTAAPPLLVALAVISTRPEAPPSLVTHTALAAWIAGTLAFGASMLHQRGGRRAARALGALASLVVLGVGALLVWVSVVLGTPVAALDPRDRAELELVDARWTHPHLGFSLPALAADIPRSEASEREAARAGGPRWADAHEVWAWEGEGTEVTVDLARARRVDRDLARRLAADFGSQLGPSSETRAVGPHAFRGEGPVTGGGHVLAHVALFERGGRAYRLLVTVVTRDRERWSRWLDGVALPAGS
jgi:hypothetical protein